MEKFLIAARLALTAVALLWRTPSKALSGFNLAIDGGLRHREIMLAVAHCGSFKVSFNNRLLLYGPHISLDDWTAILRERALFFKVVCEFISYFLRPNPVQQRPLMMSALLHSLLWFHEACRERLSLLAVVKFSASMDALAGGGREKGVCNLIWHRVGREPDAKAFSDGTTTKAAVQRIYNYGRSRTIHGTNDEFAADWDLERGRAEQLARLSLIQCIEWMARNGTEVDPRALVAP